MSDGLLTFLDYVLGIVLYTGVLCALFYHRRPPAPGRTYGFLFVGQEKFVMAKTIVQGSTHTATAVFTDAQGAVHPLAPGNVPVWSVSDPAGATLAPAADGMTCAVTAGSVDGDYTLTVTAEGDPTPGVDTIVVNFAFSVTDPEDTQGTITMD